MCHLRREGEQPLTWSDLQSNIEAWVKEWKLSAAEQQRLYLAIADLFRANKVNHEPVVQWWQSHCLVDSRLTCLDPPTYDFQLQNTLISGLWKTSAVKICCLQSVSNTDIDYLLLAEDLRRQSAFSGQNGNLWLLIYLILCRREKLSSRRPISSQ